jgi:hypothetical protein
VGDRRDQSSDPMNANTVRASASVSRCLLVVSSDSGNGVTLRKRLSCGGRHAIRLDTLKFCERPPQQNVERVAPQAPHRENREEWMS